MLACILDNKFKTGAGAVKIKISSSRKLKFGSGTISVFAMMGKYTIAPVAGR